jgi:hypothetical protein
MSKRGIQTCGALAVPALAFFLAACAESAPPTEPTLDPRPVAAASVTTASTSDLVTVPFGGSSLEYWPFTGRSPSLSDPSDPMNLLLIGMADPRLIRTALLFLNGDRSAYGFPAAFIDCVWKDAIGDVQSAYTTPYGWTANPIQLQCGDYNPLRFHLRLFRAGSWTLGGAHFEVLIPNTDQHEILSWDLARNLVVLDLVRAGILGAAPAYSAPIYPSPYRDIRAAVYNGLPAQLIGLIGGPVPPVSAPVPLYSDQKAALLSIASESGKTPVVARQDLLINYNQVIPKPFCVVPPATAILVTGPVTLTQSVTYTPSGNYSSRFHARGWLNITPIDPNSGPVGEPYRAHINQHSNAVMTDAQTLVSDFWLRVLVPPNSPGRGQYMLKFRIGPNGALTYSLDVDCGT